jgi:hypothetical protein
MERLKARYREFPKSGTAVFQHISLHKFTACVGFLVQIRNFPK